MIYLTGDTHGTKGLSRFYEKNWPSGQTLTKNDYLVILGDFGIPWNNNGSDRYWLQWLEAQPWTTLFVDGNHDNFSYLNSLPVTEWHNGHIHKLNDSVFHLMRGEVFLLDDKKILAAGGAASIDKQYRVPYASWWPEETWSSEDRRKLSAAAREHTFDYVFAHTAPEHIVTRCLGDAFRFDDPVSKDMEDLDIRFTGKWYFGHFHVNKMLDNTYICLFDKIVPLGGY